MTPPKKPDWMEIADNDGGLNNSYPKAKKSHPVLIAATALVLTFGGAVIAQTNQDQSRSTQQPLLVQASQSVAMASPAVSPVAPNLTSSGKNTIPAIAIPPVMKDDDDDDGDDYDDDDDDGDGDDDDDD
jgi:hypothetical protein